MNCGWVVPRLACSRILIYLLVITASYCIRVYGIIFTGSYDTHLLHLLKLSVNEPFRSQIVMDKMQLNVFIIFNIGAIVFIGM
jgi:hypothetical protein